MNGFRILIGLLLILHDNSSAILITIFLFLYVLIDAKYRKLGAIHWSVVFVKTPD